jgi:N-acylneuraminate cytidylyltransferase
MNIAFVPVRCGSKSIPFKNIKPLCGYPLVYWVLNALQHAKKIDAVFVATDCNQIKDITNSFGFSKVKVYDRDPKNAVDTSSTESVMLEFLEKNKFDSNDNFVLVQATNPFVKSQDFDKAFDLLSETKSDSLITCARMKRFFWSKDGKPINYDYMNRPRRQDFEGNFLENGAFYINEIGNVLSTRNRLFGKIAVYEMPEYTSVEIDEEDDWVIVEMLMKKYILEKPVAKNIKLIAMDVDGVLTDGGMYYFENGVEGKKFNTLDGKGIELAKKKGVKIAIITSENTVLVTNRATKLKVDYLYQGANDKLSILKEICAKEKIELDEVAYIGDDLGDFDVLGSVGLAACPINAVEKIKSIKGIIKLNKFGGAGVVREFIEYIFKN